MKNLKDLKEELVENKTEEKVEEPAKAEAPAERKVHKVLGWEITKAEKPAKEKKEKEEKKPGKVKSIAKKVAIGVAVTGTALLAGGFVAGRKSGEQSEGDGFAAEEPAAATEIPVETTQSAE